MMAGHPNHCAGDVSASSVPKMTLVSPPEAGGPVQSAGVLRTARKLFDGEIFA